MDSTFISLGVAKDLTDRLAQLGITTPTPIQAKAIPEAVAGRDVVGIAQTGTGKTLAFGLPVLHRLLEHHGKALIILPTRELAEQVDTTLKELGRPFGLRTSLIIGGAAMGAQILSLRRRPNVVVGTPGRIVDHMEKGTLRLTDVTILVLDEADRMLDMGFAPQVNTILAGVPTSRQTLLFSATMPTAIERIAAAQLKNPTRVQLSATGSVADNVTQELFVLAKSEKTALLAEHIRQNPGPVLVFTRTKHGARKLCQTIQTFGQTAAEIHGNRSLAQRREALQGFKNGRYHVLVATDVAARGIDVTGIEMVINFDIPDQPEDYVHRIGRTARAGCAGKAVSYAAPDQARLVQAIERLMRKSIPRSRSIQPNSISQPVSAPQLGTQPVFTEFNDIRAMRWQQEHSQQRQPQTQSAGRSNYGGRNGSRSGSQNRRPWRNRV